MSNHDHYTDSHSGVLKNRFGINVEQELEDIEASLVTVRCYELVLQPLEGAFDLNHLKALHKYMFGDVYEWAGNTRTIDISKGNSMFAHFVHIETSAIAMFKKLSQENHLRGLSKAEFSKKAAYYLGEINALHPFREGNGRAQREFISHLAYGNGFFIDWQHITQKRMIEASIKSFNGDCSLFEEYISTNLQPL